MTVIPMTEEIAQRTPVQNLIATVRGDNSRAEIQKALPEGVSVNRFESATVTALLQNPDLAKCDETSFFLALVKCAQDGLFPDGREAALVPYKGKVSYLPMIHGVRKTAAEFGWTIRTHVVYANDQFEHEQGTDDRITHKPTPIGADRGELVAAYAIAHHRDGRRSITEVMTAADVAKAKDVAQTDRVWKQWPAQMWEKTVGHRIAKKLPLDPVDQQRLTRILDAVDLGPGESARLLYGPGAEASFSEIPSGAHPYVNRPPDIEVPPADAPVNAEPAESPPAEPGTPGGSSDTPAEAREESPSAVAAAAPVSLPEPDEEAVMLAAEAAEFVPATGRFSADGTDGPLDLAGILDLGADGRAYLTMCLARLDAGAWRSATEAFARIHLPEEYARAIASRQEAA